MAGMDEGYLNITPYMAEHGLLASEAVAALRAEVVAKTGLTISAGIAPNTMLAKICSDRNKPNGQFELAFEGAAIRAFMRDLPIRTIPGIGKVHERVLQSMGVVVRTSAGRAGERAEMLILERGTKDLRGHLQAAGRH